MPFRCCSGQPARLRRRPQPKPKPIGTQTIESVVLKIGRSGCGVSADLIPSCEAVDHGWLLLTGPSRTDHRVCRERMFAPGRGAAVCSQRELRDQAGAAFRSNGFGGACPLGAAQGQRQTGPGSRLLDRRSGGHARHHHAGTGRAACDRPQRDGDAGHAVPLPLSARLHL